MNTSSKELESIINQTPIDPESGHRLVSLIERAKTTGGQEYTLDHLIYKIQPESQEALALAMRKLVHIGIARRAVRVQSQKERGGIGEFSSTLDVPEEIYDWRADEVIQVRPEDLRVVYKF